MEEVCFRLVTQGVWLSLGELRTLVWLLFILIDLVDLLSVAESDLGFGFKGGLTIFSWVEVVVFNVQGSKV